MSDVEIEVVVSCRSCGATLEATDSKSACYGWKRSEIRVDVDPCAKCLAEAKAEGAQEAQAEIDDAVVAAQDETEARVRKEILAAGPGAFLSGFVEEPPK